eukprot:TRINITY_DN27698_c0_g3_i1.p1 TRINITY_DN27698_c0_g3~~TRINITY_DN27698_c0_g3_i1.p1  ORF type:complete len:375 (+),score=84.48 TRINITY_DN27698_c0_g3_i1:57-1127(+)
MTAVTRAPVRQGDAGAALRREYRTWECRYSRERPDFQRRRRLKSALDEESRAWLTRETLYDETGCQEAADEPPESAECDEESAVEPSWPASLSESVVQTQQREKTDLFAKVDAAEAALLEDRDSQLAAAERRHAMRETERARALEDLAEARRRRVEADAARRAASLEKTELEERLAEHVADLERRAELANGKLGSARTAAEAAVDASGVEAESARAREEQALEDISCTEARLPALRRRSVVLAERRRSAEAVLVSGRKQDSSGDWRRLCELLMLMACADLSTAEEVEGELLSIASEKARLAEAAITRRDASAVEASEYRGISQELDSRRTALQTELETALAELATYDSKLTALSAS